MAERNTIPEIIATMPTRWYERTLSFRKRCAKTTVTAGEEVAIGVTMETKPTRSPRYHAKKADTSIRPSIPSFNQLPEVPTGRVCWPGISTSEVTRAVIEMRVRKKPIK